ncbi:MucR family transcriptional regulator [Mesorhizobium microcysteis]|uniref:MucR family transcriptional regulator n=1 Tax=Neoaquamicrobium microcysteis TaxID=2682781 RepID=A0A5D4H507_9HYPH|nr:MucR family transcriptional regulator [Mesorhizobium microcysteis]TYR35687.1 MucR family transcriptional regulator [Mesorhizobium microcysteis]
MAKAPISNDQKTYELELTANVVSAYVANNAVPLADLPNLISSVANALRSVSGGSVESAPEAKQEPAVPIKKSVTPDYIISLEDGKKFKSLKRTLATRYGLTPDQYRAKWGRPHDYPMVAPNYAAARSALAKNIGLGRKPKEEPAPAKAKRGRNKSAAG